MTLQGKYVVLTPIQPEEKDEFYTMVTTSYGSQFWYDKEEKSKRTKAEFFSDWTDSYFNYRILESGQCFWIIVNGKKIGQVNYNKIDKKNNRVEIDILIGPQEFIGKGYGTDALKTLLKYLFYNINIHKVYIEARANNPRAIRVYEKVGFNKEGLLKEENYFNGKFIDCIRFGILKKDFLI